MRTIDLRELPNGQRYEDRYGGYIDIFKQIALSPAEDKISVNNAPWSWAPLLYHLNCDLPYSRMVFKYCPLVRSAMTQGQGERSLDRTAIEVLCGFRPETADCLWKCDMDWDIPPGRVRDYPLQREFIVTSNGSFHRQEVRNWMHILEMYKPRKRKVLLVPCAADKPYPSLLHQKCLEIMPDDYYLACASGVTGIAPQDLWPYMPWYDSGIPNQWRLYEIVKEYFTRHYHTHVVVYCDFYGQTLQEAFRSMQRQKDVSFVIPPVRYADYLDLMDPDRLAQLKQAFRHGSSRTSDELG